MLDDKEIVGLFREDENEAFKLLIDKYKIKLYWHIRKIVMSHNDTDDIIQNVFIKVWLGLKEFRSESKLYTWLYRIATNESLNFLEEKKRKTFSKSMEISDLLMNNLESDVYFIGDDIQLELQKAILTLSEKQRLIFNMRYFDNIPYDDIAEILQVANGTIKATYHTAVKKIEISIKQSLSNINL